MPVMLGTEDWCVTVHGVANPGALAEWLFGTGVRRGDVIWGARLPEVMVVIEAPSADAALTEARRMLADTPVRFESVEVTA